MVRNGDPVHAVSTTAPDRPGLGSLDVGPHHPDERGRQLEVVAVGVQGDQDPEPVLLVIHVMPHLLPMTKRNPPTITTDTPIGPDVDLDREDVRLADGTRLTPVVAEAIVEAARRGGRPSLSGRAAHSPQIAFRVPAEVRDRASQVAADEGKTVSQLAREALDARLGVRS